MIIFPTGLLEGERLAQCSDQAQLHFPRLVALANGHGRVELRISKILALAYKHIANKPTSAQLTAWVSEYRDHHLLFIYSTDDGEIWGQWCMPKNALPRFKTADDNRSPAPNESSFEAFSEGYQKRKKAKANEAGDYLKISETSGEFGKSSEALKTFALGIGIGSRSKVTGVGEEQEQKPLSLVATNPLVTESAEDFLQAWNVNRGTLAKVLKLSASRRKKVAARVKEGITIERFTEAVKIAASTPFLRGESQKGAWKCSFDFLTRDEDNLLKVLEHRYGEPDQPKSVFVEVPAEQWLGGGSLA